MNNFVKQINQYCKDRVAVTAVILFFGIFVFLNVLFFYSDGDPKVDDHYFHIKYAYLLRTEGLDVVKHFDWIYLGSDNSGGSRYALSLFQISLIPFTYFDDLLIGLNVADAFYASVVIALIYFILQKSKVKYPLFFSIILLSSTYFFDRLMLGRAFVFICALVFLEMYFAVEKKYKALFFTVILHVLWHQSTYFIPFVVIGSVELARYVAVQKIFFKNIMSTILAIFVGMLFFPGFPMSIFEHIKSIFSIQAGVTANNVSMSGDELIPKGINEYFIGEELFLLLLIFCLVGVISLLIAQLKNSILISKHVNKIFLIWIYGLFIFTIINLVGSIFVSGRFFDFLIPSVFVLSAFVVTVLCKMTKNKNNVHVNIIVKTTIILFFCIIIANRFVVTYKKENSFDYGAAQQAAEWIHQRSDIKKDKVFLYNWSSFTLMFFENSDNIYSTGIEPMALKEHDDAKYWQYYNLFKNDYYCDKLRDCSAEVAVIRDGLSTKSDTEKSHFNKKNGKAMIDFIKNDFDAKFIVSSSPRFTNAILSNFDLIDSYASFVSDKFNGQYMEYTVFKLK